MSTDLITPFSQAGIIPFSKSKGSCFITKEKLDKGEEVFYWRYADIPGSLTFYAKKDAFYSSPYAKVYEEKFLKNKYVLEDFPRLSFICHPQIKSVIYDYEKAVEVFINPSIQPPAVFYLSKEKLLKSESNFHREIFALLGIYLKCGYAERLLDLLPTFPTHSWLLFAMSDDLRFQQKLADMLHMPELSDIMKVLTKKDFLLEDFIAIMKFTKANPGFVEMAATFLDQYYPHLSYTLSAYSFSRFSNLENGRLCFLFITDPQKNTWLQRYIEEGEFPVDNYGYLTYIQCYYYQAVIFHFLYIQQFDKAKHWADRMPAEISYYKSGSPSAFISRTQKMVEQYIKMQEKGKV